MNRQKRQNQSKPYQTAFGKSMMLGVSSGLAVLLCSVNVFAPAFSEEASPDTPPDALSALETQYFAANFQQEAMEDRLARIEEYVFGEAQGGDVATRQARLQGLLKDKAQQTAPDGPDKIVDEDNNQPVPLRRPERPDATDYPTVTAMEKKVFGQDYRSEAITDRLARLEKSVFGKPNETLELVDRVDRLQAKVPASAILYDQQEALYNPGRPQSPSRPPQQQPVYGGQAYSPMPRNNPSPYQIGFGEVYLKLDEMERSFFGGQSFSGRLIPERLENLERHVYGSTFSNESMDSRLNRLNSAYQRRYGQYGTQQGGYTARPPVQSRPGTGSPSYTDYYNIYAPPGGASPRPQPYRYRGEAQPETASPPRSVTVNQQSQWQTPFGEGRHRSSKTYVTSAPGTVVIQDTTEFPGMGAYTGPVMVGGGGVVPGLGVVGLDANTQLLNQLELSSTGIMNPSLPAEVRLSQLENRFVGQPQPGLSFNQRLAQVQRAVQVHRLTGGGVGGLYTTSPGVVQVSP